MSVLSGFTWFAPALPFGSNVLPAMFVNFQGALSPAGAAQAAFAIPKLSLLAGLQVDGAFVTHDGGGARANRYLPIIPDDLFRLSLTQGLAPFATGNVGLLSGTAEGSAKLNLAPLGKGANGLLIFLAAAVVDPKAPLGLAEISDPMTLVVEGL